MTLHIKKFIDKMAVVETKKSRDVILSLDDARALRDDVARLLAELHDLKAAQGPSSDSIQIEIKGGSFK